MADDDEPNWTPPEGWMETPWEVDCDPGTVVECPGTESERESENYRVVSKGYVDEEPLICTGTAVWPLSERYARILAAAPDLLEALSNLASWFLPQEAVGGSNARLFKGMPPHAVVKDALAAIAKATGA